MSRVKIIKKTSGVDPELGEMFNQMLGDGNPEIIAEKSKTILSTLRLIGQILDNFAKGPMRGFADYGEWLDEFAQFGAKVTQLGESKDMEYKELKKHNVLRQVILCCKELVSYNAILTTEKWITDHPGLVFEPFAFTKFDIKHVWNNESTTKTVREYVLKIIKLLYDNCYKVYKTTTSPDVDVKKFSQIISAAISKIQTLPELSRCKNAFRKLEESTHLLEDNFEDYYKDMLESENPNTIIENFIVDVSKDQKMNISLMREFRTLINFYTKQTAGKIKDPRYKGLMDQLHEKMSLFEKSAGSADKKE
jgi:hypothetical protein